MKNIFYNKKVNILLIFLTLCVLLLSSFLYKLYDNITENSNSTSSSLKKYSFVHSPEDISKFLNLEIVSFDYYNSITINFTSDLNNIIDSIIIESTELFTDECKDIKILKGDFSSFNIYHIYDQSLTNKLYHFTIFFNEKYNTKQFDYFNTVVLKPYYLDFKEDNKLYFYKKNNYLLITKSESNIIKLANILGKVKYFNSSYRFNNVNVFLIKDNISAYTFLSINNKTIRINYERNR